MIKWLVVFGIAFIIVLVGSVGRVPFSERKLATSEETRAKFAEENTPTYTRQQVVSFIEDYLRTSCESGEKYLRNIDSFEAKWTRSPRNDDHHKRDVREWTVSDPITSSFWRLYENTMEIVTVRADC
ncbi:MAG TPA: hypothetical protein DDY93_02775 [Dehalococcoidia bacterium]|nr:hypothetical protein [Dehalococcoidia bacterium]